MGQRLCLTTYGASERCYNIYVHWGGYTLYGLELASSIIELTTDYCEEKYNLDWKKMTKYDYIEALLMNDAGIRINWFDQDFEDGEEYPEIAKICDDFIEKDFLRSYPAYKAEFVKIKEKIFDDSNLKAFTQKELNLKGKTFLELFRSLTEESLLEDYFDSIVDKKDAHLDDVMTKLLSVCTDADRNNGLICVTEKGMDCNESASDGYLLDVDFDRGIVTDNISCAETAVVDDFKDYMIENYSDICSIVVCGDETIAESRDGYKYKFRNIYIDTNAINGGLFKGPEDYYEISFEEIYSTMNMYDSMERATCYSMRFLPEAAKTDPTKAFETYGVFNLVA